MTRLTESIPGVEAPPQSGTRVIAGLRTVGSLTFLSRALGLVRDVGMAVFFGNGPLMDAFSVAFRVPNLARRMFGEGALTAAFVPAFVREFVQRGPAAAWMLASAVLTVLAAVLSAIVVLGELALWGAAAWAPPAGEGRLLIGLTAVMLPYLVLICLAAQVGAMLQARERFAWPAFSPVLLNLVWIVTLWGVLPWLGTPTQQIYAVAVCVVVAGGLQLAAPLPTLWRLGFRYTADWRPARRQVAALSRAMVPIVIGLSVTQLNTLADSLIAWGLSKPAEARRAGSEVGGQRSEVAGRSGRGAEEQRTRLDPPSSILDPQSPAAASSSHWQPIEAGSASALYYAQRIYQFPLGVFGVALATVLFPLLSRHAGEGRLDRLRGDLQMGLRLVICVGLPASLGLILLAEPITVLLFRYGAFDGEAVRQTAAMIAAYGSGVWAYCGVVVVQRGYYAVEDRATPLRIGLAMIVLNLVLNFTLIWPLGGTGLAVATAISAGVQVVAVVWCIQRRIGRLDWGGLCGTGLRAMLASAVMAAACLAALGLLTPDDGFVPRVLRVVVPVAASIAAWQAAARILGMSELKLLRRGGAP